MIAYTLQDLLFSSTKRSVSVKCVSNYLKQEETQLVTIFTSRSIKAFVQININCPAFNVSRPGGGEIIGLLSSVRINKYSFRSNGGQGKIIIVSVTPFAGAWSDKNDDP